MKKYAYYIMGSLYVVAGINHFWHPAFYLLIMPPWLPCHMALVQVSGVCEIICGLLVLFRPTRRFGAWLTIALLIAIFPANVQMLINWLHTGHPYIWIAILRLPLQAYLIWWAWKYTKARNKSKLTSI